VKIQPVNEASFLEMENHIMQSINSSSTSNYFLFSSA